MSNPNWGEVVTTTLAKRRKIIADTISRNNIFITEARRRGKVKTASGGRTITQPIMMGTENANFQWYYGREGLSVAGQEVLIHDPAEFQRRLAQRQQVELALPFAFLLAFFISFRIKIARTVGGVDFVHQQDLSVFFSKLVFGIDQN